MILPILGFIEHGRDRGICGSSRPASILVQAYQYVGMPISIPFAIPGCLLLVLARQAINYLTQSKSSGSSGPSPTPSVRVFTSVLQSRADNIRKFKAGDFTQTVDFESQATAAIARIYGNDLDADRFICLYGAVLVWLRRWRVCVLPWLSHAR